MQPVRYPIAMHYLIKQLKALPGIGPRSAERLAIWLIQAPKACPQDLAQAIANAKEQIETCPLCGFFAEANHCLICRDSKRSQKVLCIVEHSAEIVALEKTGYRGLYHCLGGKLSPLDDVTPEQLRFAGLWKRLEKMGEEGEVVLALSSDVEGEATICYLMDKLEAYPCRISRLAQGISVGGALESTDPITLANALSDRRIVKQV